MRHNKLREMLKAGQPTVGTHVRNVTPTFVEVIGHTGLFDYVEFSAEYAPFDLYDLENFCRAAELYDMSTMIKVDQEPRRFLAQRAIGAGFQSVLFADCHTVDDVQECVRAVRPDVPGAGGTHGAAFRRSALVSSAGTPEYVRSLEQVVIVLMVEKKPIVDEIEQVLLVAGVDMLQWGPADYCMSIGRPGETDHPSVKAAERRVIEAGLKMGIPSRAEIDSADAAKYYLDLGVRHFCIGTDVTILYQWLKQNGEALRRAIEGS
ncbi:MAG: HpcH/HpaI aldolase family protein [Anaerolineae bacterium]